MRDMLLILSVVVLAGCPALVSVDDPRGSKGPGGPSSASGECSGSAVFCDDRSRAQCGSGCRIAPMCHGPNLERCAEHRNADGCEGDTACVWAADWCLSLDACGIYASQTGCLNDPLHECVWGDACTGTVTSCYDIKTSAACTANYGCSWKPE
jgi:hypothetical protein